jgi:hypothetical protein
MRRRLKQTAIAFILVFAVAQFVSSQRENPPTDECRMIQANIGTTSRLVAVLDRSSGDCHSNNTVWPWYTQVAPASWLMASALRVSMD